MVIPLSVCRHCGATRRDVTLWSQIVAIRDPRDVVCCLRDL